MSEGINSEIRQLLTHFVDYLKNRNITTLFTAAITLETIKSNPSDEGISAMVDTWILVRDLETNSERNRGINILKSRGMNHSTQIREFVITENGINILPIYLSSKGVLTGSAKLEHTLRKEEEDKLHENRIKNQKSEISKKRKMLGGETTLLKAELESEIEDLNMSSAEYDLKKETETKNETEVINLRTRTRSSSEKSKGRNK
jgi:circadian clock protein KaiC